MKELYTDVQIWHAIHELSNIRARYDISNEKDLLKYDACSLGIKALRKSLRMENNLRKQWRLGKTSIYVSVLESADRGVSKTSAQACGFKSHPKHHRLDRVGSLLGETVWQIGKTVDCWTDSFDMLPWWKAYTFALRANASDGLRAHIPPVAPPRKG